MKQLTAFCKKEWMEMFRTGRFLILLIVFVLLGIMSPAMAKLTPAMLELVSDQLAEQGMIMTEVKVDAFSCWQQYYKNVPIGLIVLVIMFSACLTNEYQKGTLINMLTKGLSRWKVIAAKLITMIAMWSLCHWICFGITYGYSILFWDNSVVSNILLGSALIYFFGIWLISLIVLGSCLFASSFAVLLTVGGGVVLSLLFGIVPTIIEYLPTYLLSAGSLMNGMMKGNDFTTATLLVLLLSAINVFLGIVSFNHKRV